MLEQSKEFEEFIREIYGEGYIPLHRPLFSSKEKDYLNECIDSNFVSSSGKKVEEFENKIKGFTNSEFAISCVNGTCALHLALKASRVNEGEEVITQALTFVATPNSIRHAGAHPVFIDVDKDTLGMSPIALEKFLLENSERRKDKLFNKNSGRIISACIPMHSFGIPCRVKEISEICKEWGLYLIEDSAESLGSYSQGKHTGNYGDLSILSFNGNKIITTGGGGMIITNDGDLASTAKHLSTTAKKEHPYEYVHDQVGYNYRMPNLNASIGCAQIEKLNYFLSVKKDLARKWEEFFDQTNINFVKPLQGDEANFWLNTILMESKEDRDSFLKYTNDKEINTRPAWSLMTKLPMYSSCYNDGLKNSIWAEDRLVNIPSSVPSN
tara:strand:+ start:17500 stop:18648 length:1149 start_codon:yes stop_codon:yes gene_type:complete